MHKTILIDFRIHKIAEDKTLNEDGFRNYVIQEKAIDDHQKAIAADVVKKCIEEVKSLSAVNKYFTESNCNNIAIIAIKCVDLEFFNSCPVEKQISSQECVKARDSVGKWTKNN